MAPGAALARSWSSHSLGGFFGYVPLGRLPNGIGLTAASHFVAKRLGIKSSSE